MKKIRVAAAVIRRDRQVLLASRPADKPPFGLEFPGGKLEPGETPGKALRRELREELALDALPGDTIYCFRSETLEIDFIRCAIAPDATPAPQEKQSCGWYDLDAGTPDDLLPNDLPFWKFLAKRQ